MCILLYILEWLVQDFLIIVLTIMMQAAGCLCIYLQRRHLRGVCSVGALHTWTERCVKNPAVQLFNPNSAGACQEGSCFLLPVIKKQGMGRKERSKLTNTYMNPTPAPISVSLSHLVVLSAAVDTHLEPLTVCCCSALSGVFLHQGLSVSQMQESASAAEFSL